MGFTVQSYHLIADGLHNNRTVRKLLAVGSGAVLVSCGLWTFTNLRTDLHRINEPDPANFDPGKVKSILKSAGVDLDVTKVLYVNQDSMAYIFEGRIRNVDKSIWTAFSNVWTRQSNGLVISKDRNKISTIGFSNYSSLDNIDPFFKEHWKDLVK